MNDKEKLFADTYIETLNLATSATIAGYNSSNTTRTYQRLMNKPEIALYIKNGLNEKARLYKVDESSLWKVLMEALDKTTTEPKYFVIDKQIIERQVPLDWNTKFKWWDSACKLLGMYDREKEDDNIELPD